MNRTEPRLLFVVPLGRALGMGLVAGCVAPPDDRPAVTAAAQAITLSPVTSFGSNPGGLRMFEFVPAGLPANAPLVVLLHGCTESASSYSTQTEWGTLANRFQFAVVFPGSTCSSTAR
jgi:poly(3-hydroxybutyrate) depolymerase